MKQRNYRKNTTSNQHLKFSWSFLFGVIYRSWLWVHLVLKSLHTLFLPSTPIIELTVSAAILCALQHRSIFTVFLGSSDSSSSASSVGPSRRSPDPRATNHRKNWFIIGDRRTLWYHLILNPTKCKSDASLVTNHGHLINWNCIFTQSNTVDTFPQWDTGRQPSVTHDD